MDQNYNKTLMDLVLQNVVGPIMAIKERALQSQVQLLQGAGAGRGEATVGKGVCVGI